MPPSPNLKHQAVQVQLGERLARFVREHSLGRLFFAPCDVVLSDTDVVQPDLLFDSGERAHLLSGGENVRGAPDLVVEILSPATAERDRGYKRALYAKHGVAEYWLVDPAAETVWIHCLRGGAGGRADLRPGEGAALAPACRVRPRSGRHLQPPAVTAPGCRSGATRPQPPVLTGGDAPPWGPRGTRPAARREAHRARRPRSDGASRVQLPAGLDSPTGEAGFGCPMLPEGATLAPARPRSERRTLAVRWAAPQGTRTIGVQLGIELGGDIEPVVRVVISVPDASGDVGVEVALHGHAAAGRVAEGEVEAEKRWAFCVVEQILQKRGRRRYGSGSTCGAARSPSRSRQARRCPALPGPDLVANALTSRPRRRARIEPAALFSGAARRAPTLRAETSRGECPSAASSAIPSRIRISLAPRPTLGIGLQSCGSSPRCSRSIWRPTS